MASTTKRNASRTGGKAQEALSGVCPTRIRVDSAQAKARRYLSIHEVFEDLSKSESSPVSSVALLLLQSVALHELEFWCLCTITEEPQQTLECSLPKYAAEAFLGGIAEGADPNDLVWKQPIYLGAEGSEGEWEIVPEELLRALGPEGCGERWLVNLPFTQFSVRKPELERRLAEVGVPIPTRWTSGDPDASADPLEDGITRRLRRMYKRFEAEDGRPPSQRKLAREAKVGRATVHRRWQLIKN